MRIAIFTDGQRGLLMEPILSGGTVFPPGRIPECRYFLTYDDFITGLEGTCDAILVARPGAEGMEGARAAKLLCPTVPLVWLSDDRAFGPESYRIGCVYFSAAAITERLLELALRPCLKFGARAGTSGTPGTATSKGATT